MCPQVGPIKKRQQKKMCAIKLTMRGFGSGITDWQFAALRRAHGSREGFHGSAPENSLLSNSIISCCRMYSHDFMLRAWRHIPVGFGAMLQGASRSLQKPVNVLAWLGLTRLLNMPAISDLKSSMRWPQVR